MEQKQKFSGLSKASERRDQSNIPSLFILRDETILGKKLIKIRDDTLAATKDRSAVASWPEKISGAEMEIDFIRALGCCAYEQDETERASSSECTYDMFSEFGIERQDAIHISSVDILSHAQMIECKFLEGDQGTQILSFVVRTKSSRSAPDDFPVIYRSFGKTFARTSGSVTMVLPSVYIWSVNQSTVDKKETLQSHSIATPQKNQISYFPRGDWTTTGTTVNFGSDIELTRSYLDLAPGCDPSKTHPRVLVRRDFYYKPRRSQSAKLCITLVSVEFDIRDCGKMIVPIKSIQPTPLPPPPPPPLISPPSPKKMFEEMSHSINATVPELEKYFSSSGNHVIAKTGLQLLIVLEHLNAALSTLMT